MAAEKIRLTLGFVLVTACLAAATVDSFFKPFINPELGDIVLFFFVVAGAITGFIAGYGLRRFRASTDEKVSPAVNGGSRK